VDEAVQVDKVIDNNSLYLYFLDFHSVLVDPGEVLGKGIGSDFELAFVFDEGVLDYDLSLLGLEF
jgi:hypothetical protein